jgi:acyl transferase domain-containing protein
MSVLDRAVRSALCILFVAALAGFSWGNSEADQRKAFIAFLADINNRPGAHVLVPSANAEKAFGPHLAHYAIILDFNKDMSVTMQNFMAQMIKFGFGPNPNPRTIEQMAAAPADLTTLKDILDKMEQGLETRLAKANADRAALKQPDDLKAVYDKTFDRLVAAPARAFENYAKALDGGVDAAIALVTYINAHRTKLVVSGMQIQAKDQRTLDELQPLMKTYQDAGERVVAVQRASDRVLGGD